MFIVVSLYFVMESVWKLLDTPFDASSILNWFLSWIFDTGK